MIPIPFEADTGPDPADESWSRQYNIQDLQRPYEPEPNWIVMAALGFIFILAGSLMADVVGFIGAGVMLIGVLLLIAARFASKYESLASYPPETGDVWQDYIDTRTAEEDHIARELARKMEIEEIVRAVKTTIRVRCRYCGTLNDEKANKCEACGGAL